MVAVLPNANIPGAPDLCVVHEVEPPEEQSDQLAERFRQQDSVEYAYVEPLVALPVWLPEGSPLKREIPSVTPDFSDRYGYLNRRQRELTQNLHGY